MIVTFNNVTISVHAKDSKEAYKKLYTKLRASDFGYTTDTFFTDEEQEDRDTSELF